MKYIICILLAAIVGLASANEASQVNKKKLFF